MGQAIEAETKWSSFCRRHLTSIFLYANCFYFDSNVYETCSPGCSWQYVGIGSNNCPAPHRRQAIIWTKEGVVCRRMNALGLDGVNVWVQYAVKIRTMLLWGLMKRAAVERYYQYPMMTPCPDTNIVTEYNVFCHSVISAGLVLFVLSLKGHMKWWVIFNMSVKIHIL